MKQFPIYLPILLCAAMLLIACGGNRESASVPADSGPVVRFVTPSDGATVSSPVKVRMNAINFTIEEAGEVRENAGHFHIMVNENCVTTGEIIPGTEGFNHYGKAQLEADLELEPGEYTLCLQIGDGLHAATDLTDTISITVE
ncbi:MAG: DUF4399 domain-containing protein [Chloroflexota bacterium]